MCFNPRAREGRDQIVTLLHYHPIVSIHAPARGATFFEHVFKQFDESFNPRAREGRDGDIPDTVKIKIVSIHAPARGATLSGSV